MSLEYNLREKLHCPRVTVALTNVAPAEQLRGLASRKSKPDEFKSVRNPLVDEEVANGWVIQKRNKSATRLCKPKTHDKRFEVASFYGARMGFCRCSSGIKGGAFLLLKANETKGPDQSNRRRGSTMTMLPLAIECKSSEKPRKFDDFLQNLREHVAMRRTFCHRRTEMNPQSSKSGPSIFVIWSSNIRPTENRRKSGKGSKRMLVGRGPRPRVLEQLVSQVGTAAQFQFLADVLEGRSVPGLEITVPAIRSRIAGGVAYSFFVSPEFS